MRPVDILGIYVVLCAALIYWILLIQRFVRFRDDIKYIKGEIYRSLTLKEYSYWKGELSILRRAVLTGLSPSRIAERRKLARARREGDEADKNFVSLLTPSIFGILLCTVCLAGSTFAWFSSSETSGIQQVEAANYAVYSVVSEKTDEGAAPIVDFVDEIRTLEAGKVYELRLEVGGNATSGYCVILLDGNRYLTEPLLPGDVLTLTLMTETEATLSVVGSWGSASRSDFVSYDGKYEFTYTGGKLIEGIIPVEPEKKPAETTTEPAETTTEPAETTTEPAEITAEPIEA